MPQRDGGERRGLVPAALGAALVTLLVFLSATGGQFLELDDLGYIVDNRHIDRLDWHTVVWAVTGFHEANWHPLTMLSLALDRQLWGLSPFGFHLTNILLHCGTVFLVCLLSAGLLRECGRRDRLAGVRSLWDGADRLPLILAGVAGGLFFGLHPLRVESVAWVSERKDVLCAFFYTAALWWYLRHAGRLREGRRGMGPYAMVLVMAALALMSKPAAVSLPLVLLLLDWYPLARLGERGAAVRALLEKLPLFLMAIAASVLTILAQHEPIMRATDLNLFSRLLIACKALLFYLSRTLWPAGLAPLYLHPGNVAITAPREYFWYALAVVAISVLAIRLASRRNRWGMLWLYYLLTLAPMLGIIQVGGQWAADRYTYLPSLGIALAWGGGVIWLFFRLRQRGARLAAAGLALLAAGQLLAYTAVTHRTIGFWRSTETIASREIALYPRQVGAAYYARAKHRSAAGDYDNALADVEEALAIALRRGLKTKYADLSMTRARILMEMGRLPEALGAAEWAIEASVGAPPAGYLAYRDELAGMIAGGEGVGRKPR